MISSARTRTKTSSELIGTNPSRSGDYNQRVVLEAVRTRGTVTCADIAAATGLTHQAAINITKRLQADGLLSDVGKTAGARGQPATRLSVNPKGAYALGLNIDREHVTLVVMDLLGETKHRASLQKPFPLPEDILAFVQKETADIYARRIVPRKRVIGLGIAMPDGISFPQFPDKPAAFDRWLTIDFPAMCADALDLPVFKENDATAAALGEHRFGQGGELASFIYVLISAGLGCGIIIDGHPYIGGKNHAGEIGNIPVMTETGKAQILWDTVSLPALFRKIGQFGPVITHVEQLNLSVPAIANGVEAWIQDAVASMMLPFVTINYILSPQMTFIGGQLPLPIVEQLCARLNVAIRQFETHMPITQFAPSTASTDASALGAAVMVFHQQLLPQ